MKKKKMIVAVNKLLLCSHVDAIMLQANKTWYKTNQSVKCILFCTLL